MQPSIISYKKGLKLCTHLVASNSLNHITSRYPIGTSLHLYEVGNMVNRKLDNLSQKKSCKNTPNKTSC